MGSLVGGWDSPAVDPKIVKYQRNKSLTKEVIEAYWKSKKKQEDDEISSSPDQPARYQRSSSLPAANTKRNLEDVKTDRISFESLMRQHAWWTLSSSAFLNEPPVIVPPEGRRTNKMGE